MSRLIFEAHRRLPAPPTDKGTITIEPPPELPRMVPASFLQLHRDAVALVDRDASR